MWHHLCGTNEGNWWLYYDEISRWFFQTPGIALAPLLLESVASHIASHMAQARIILAVEETGWLGPATQPSMVIWFVLASVLFDRWPSMVCCFSLELAVVSAEALRDICRDDTTGAEEWMEIISQMNGCLCHCHRNHLFKKKASHCQYILGGIW